MRSNRILPFFAVFAVLIVLSSSAPAQSDKDSIIEIGNRVADWQLANVDSLDGIRTFQDRSRETKGWIQAAFYVGLERWARTSGEAAHRESLQKLAEGNAWELGERYWHADDQAIAQVYLALDDANVEPTQAVFDEVIELNPQGSLEFTENRDGKAEGGCQQRWCWCDALFMAPPAWAALSRVTGNPDYRDYAIKEYQAAQDYLFDAEEKLFFRDSRFFERRTEHGNKIFWSRGNGWVFAGLPLLLEQLPENHESRSYFMNTFKEMANTFKSIQTDAGLWAPSLLDWQHDPSPETSGSAFIVFGMAWGVNRGFLDKAEFGPVIDEAWQALTGAVDENGKLGWVQQVGNAPDEVRAGDTQFYGNGAFLLAASEMLDYKP